MTGLLVLVSGLPASGKSTVARATADVLGIPFVDKDDLLEAMFRADHTVDPSERRLLSRRADELLQDRATSLESVCRTTT